MSDILNSLTPEQIEEMINNPGQTFGGAVGDEATSFAPRSSVDISNRVAQGVRPNVSGNSHDVTGGRINRPSANLSRRLAEGDERMKAEAAAQKAAEEEARINSSPDTINNRIGFLERSNKKLLRELAELKKLLKDTNA